MGKGATTLIPISGLKGGEGELKSRKREGHSKWLEEKRGALLKQRGGKSATARLRVEEERPPEIRECQEKREREKKKRGGLKMKTWPPLRIRGGKNNQQREGNEDDPFRPGIKKKGPYGKKKKGNSNLLGGGKFNQ